MRLRSLSSPAQLLASVRWKSLTSYLPHLCPNNLHSKNLSSQMRWTKSTNRILLLTISLSQNVPQMLSPLKTRKTLAETFSRRVKDLMEHKDLIPSFKIDSRVSVASANLVLTTLCRPSTWMTEQILQQDSLASTSKIATEKLVQIADHLKCHSNSYTLARLIPSSYKFTRTILDSSQICRLSTRQCEIQ